jgi:hypothetical protein
MNRSSRDSNGRNALASGLFRRSDVAGWDHS